MIGDKIRKLRTDCTMTQQELADKIDVSPSTVGMYEQNRRLPDVNTVISLAKLFSVTSDYILGITQVSQVEVLENEYFTTTKTEFDLTFHNRFTELCRDEFDNGEDYTEISNKLHISKDVLADFSNNIDKLPNLSDLIKIASYFNVSLDYLIGRSDYEKVVMSDQNELLRYFDKLKRPEQIWTLGQIIDILKKDKDSKQDV